jgi:single-strand DNA-binding protein
MKSVNKAILIGNVGKDPEIKYTPSGTCVAKFSLATSERYKDKGSDTWNDRTEWHNVIAWAKLAEIVGEYVKKGGKLYLEGKLQTSSWDDRESGQKKYKTEIVASDIVLLGGRGEETESTYSHGKHLSDEEMARKSGPNNPNIRDEDIPF